MKQHFHWLDLIRFFAALCVVLVHVRGQVWETYSLLNPESQNIITTLFYALFSLGFIGVLVFFVLSGFLVGGITLKRTFKNNISFKKYVLDRSVRIGLPLIGSIILIIFVDLFLGNNSDYPTLVGNLFALQGIFVDDAGGVFWTLSYEIWFYILIGGIVLLCSKHQYIGCILIALSLCAFTTLKTYMLLILFCGILSYYLTITIQHRSKIIIYGSATCFCIATILILLVNDSLAFDKSLFQSFLNEDILCIIIGISSALFISNVVKTSPKTKCAMIIDNIGSKLALFSYSLYLTHWQVLRIVNHYFGRSATLDAIAIFKFIITVAVCILFAYIFYWITERNTTKVKKCISNYFSSKLTS